MKKIKIKSNKIKTTLIGVGNLNYVKVENVPMNQSSTYGEMIDSRVLSNIEKSVALELIKKRVPLRGLEVEFLRSVLGTSQREFATQLGLSHVSVLKWEKMKTKPLSLVNEVAVKALIAGKMGMKLPASIETLSSDGKTPKELCLNYPGSEKVSKKTGT